MDPTLKQHQTLPCSPLPLSAEIYNLSAARFDVQSSKLNCTAELFNLQ